MKPNMLNVSDCNLQTSRLVKCNNLQNRANQQHFHFTSI